MAGQRRSIRLQGYDYSRAGAYFITLCTQNREPLFGNIVNGAMHLNDAGRMVQQCWDDVPLHFSQVTLDAFVVMPNHIHGIVVIVGVAGAVTVGAKNISPLHPHGTSKTIGSIFRGFKIGVTKWMRGNTPVHDIWQRNYWEHIVRNESKLNRIREYISYNPQHWELDRLHAGGSETISAPKVCEPTSRYGMEEWMV